jgi:hypothetical protein
MIEQQEKVMVYLITGLVVLVMWYKVMRVLGKAVVESPENELKYGELAGYLTLSMIAIEIVLFVRLIHI